jgi:hypothetical protein
MAAMRQQVLLPFPADPDHDPVPQITPSQELLAAIADLLLQVLAASTARDEEDHHDH